MPITLLTCACDTSDDFLLATPCRRGVLIAGKPHFSKAKAFFSLIPSFLFTQAAAKSFLPSCLWSVNAGKARLNASSPDIAEVRVAMIGLPHLPALRLDTSKSGFASSGPGAIRCDWQAA